MARDDRRQGAEDRPSSPDLHRRARSRLRADRAPRLTWKLTIRAGPRVQRQRFASLEPALEELVRQSRALAGSASSAPVDIKLRRFEPAQRVAARLELSGPQRLLPDVHAGLDVRGDGSIEAWRGRVQRSLIEPRSGEDPVDAVARTLRPGPESPRGGAAT